MSGQKARSGRGRGAVAQLGARLNGIEKVKGSIPFRSINVRIVFHADGNGDPQKQRPEVVGHLCSEPGERGESLARRLQRTHQTELIRELQPHGCARYRANEISDVSAQMSDRRPSGLCSGVWHV